MTAAEKYLEEKDDMKAARINRILEAAFVLFSEKGIDTITMNDIAKKAEIGVASLYRYFETKEEIAIRTAIWAWEQQKNQIVPILETGDFNDKSGIEEINTIFDLFLSLYENQTSFLSFIYFFDSYAVRTKIDKIKLKDYEEIIFSVQKIVEKAITKGIQDNTISKQFVGKEEMLYLTLMNSLFTVCQKLSLNKNLLSRDSEESGKAELKLLSDFLIKGIKA
ncbi:MAG: TetR/AcrR family transcriptional regulator [Treponema sp.]|nr:TetR/AcrR family transcriptional regulator [Treponema sp.]